jgi:hypothetical protein
MEGPDSVDALPDLDSMSTAFLPSSDDEDDEEEDEPAVRSAPSRNTATRSQFSSEDFNTKDMAQAIQTILKREDKG